MNDKGLHNLSASHNFLKDDLMKGNHVCGICSRIKGVRKWCKFQYGITQGPDGAIKLRKRTLNKKGLNKKGRTVASTNDDG
jgi:hypothetical protein